MTIDFASFPQYPQGPQQPPGQPPLGPPPGGGGQPPFGPPPGGSPSAQGGQHPLSIAALVCGILGVLTFWCCLGIPFGIAATVTGFLGRKRAEESGQSTGMATAGLVLGIVALAVTIIIIIISVASGGYDFNYSTD